MHFDQTTPILRSFDEAKALAAVKAAGAEIVTVDREPFRQAMQPVMAKFVTTPDLQKLVKAIQDIK